MKDLTPVGPNETLNVNIGDDQKFSPRSLQSFFKPPNDTCKTIENITTSDGEYGRVYRGEISYITFSNDTEKEFLDCINNVDLKKIIQLLKSSLAEISQQTLEQLLRLAIENNNFKITQAIFDHAYHRLSQDALNCELCRAIKNNREVFVDYFITKNINFSREEWLKIATEVPNSNNSIQKKIIDILDKKNLLHLEEFQYVLNRPVKTFLLHYGSNGETSYTIKGLVTMKTISNEEQSCCSCRLF